jgi:hypothetical protein
LFLSAGCANSNYEGLSNKKSVNHFIFYYDKQDKNSIGDIAGVLNDNFEKITSNYEADADEKRIQIYIYPDLTTFHEAIGWPDAEDWVVGTASGGDAVKMVSPNNADASHNYDQMLQVAVHEFTHIVIANIEKTTAIPRWLSEGIAEYEAEQMDENRKSAVRSKIIAESVPTLNEMKMSTSTEFGKMGGYELSYTIVEYIVSEYGYEKLILLVRNPDDFTGAFGVSEADFETGWLGFINENYKTSYRPFIG